VHRTLGLYLELFVSTYDPKEAHRLIDMGSEGVVLFGRERIGVRPEAIAALLLGTNQLSNVVVGRVDVSFSLFHLTSTPIEVRLEYFTCALTPREPTVITQAEVAAFWEKLSDSLPPHVRERRSSGEKAGSFSSTDQGEKLFGRASRMLLSTQFELAYAKVSIAHAAHLLDLLIDFPDQAATYERLEPSYLLLGCGPCICGWRRKPRQSLRERVPLLSLQASRGPAHAEESGDHSNSGMPRLKLPPRLREIDSLASLASYLSPRQQTARVEQSARVDETPYAYSAVELIIEHLRISNSDASFAADSCALKDFAQERPDGTCLAYKRVVLGNVYLQRLNQYGLASQLNTPVRIEARATIQIAVKGARVMSVGWHVIWPDSVGVSLPSGSNPVQAIVEFLAHGAAKVLQPPRETPLRRFVSDKASATATLVDAAAATFLDGRVKPAAAGARARAEPRLAQRGAVGGVHPLPVISVSVSIGHSEETAKPAVEVQLAAAAELHCNAARLDRQHAKVRKALKDLALDSAGGYARLLRLLAQHQGGAQSHPQPDGDANGLSIEQFKQMLASFDADLPDSLLQQVVAQIDVDGNGRIGARELLEAYGYAFELGDAPDDLPMPPEVMIFNSKNSPRRTHTGRSSGGGGGRSAGPSQESSGCTLM